MVQSLQKSRRQKEGRRNVQNECRKGLSTLSAEAAEPVLLLLVQCTGTVLTIREIPSGSEDNALSSSEDDEQFESTNNRKTRSW